MSRANHRLPGRLDGPTARLGAVMGLPLVDGVFAALVLAEALATWRGVAVVGVLVFGGAGTLAVLLGSDRSQRSLAHSVLVVGVPLVALAAVEGALAPAVGRIVDLATFERFAGLVLLVVAAEIGSPRIADYLPGAGTVVALGLVASVDPSGAVVLDPDPVAGLRAAGAALVGVGLALALVAFRPALRYTLDVDRLRFGSSVALAVLGLSVGDLLPDSPLPLAVLAVAGLLAIDPGDTDRRGDPERERHPNPRRDDPGTEPP